jgi:hypothetical protein
MTIPNCIAIIKGWERFSYCYLHPMAMMEYVCAGEKLVHHRGTEFTEFLFVVPIGLSRWAQHELP